MFIADADSGEIVTPGVEITQLLGSLDVIDPPDQFYVQVGVPNSINSNLQYTQKRARRRTAIGGHIDQLRQFRRRTTENVG